MAEAKEIKPLTLVVVLVVLLAATVLGIYRWQHRTVDLKAPSTENVSLEETVKRIATHMVVNPKEVPVMLMVTDPEKMREANPWFYGHASVGDRVLLWTDQAVLYSFSKDRVLQVLPLNVPTSTLSQLLESATPQTSSTPTSTASATTTRMISVEIRNASGQPGAAKLAAKKLDPTQFQIVSVGDARRIQKTTLVVAAPSVDTSSLLSIFHATTGTTPIGEAETKADAIVFVGER